MSRHTEYGNSPVGRLISGDPWTKQTTDQNNRPIPEEKQSYWFAVAIEKNAPGMNEMLGLMFKAAQAGYANAPHIMAQINAGLAATAFSWKVVDGDEMRANPTSGQQELRWKHGAGCWIAKFSTTLPIASAKYHGAVPTYCDPSEIKRGYYVNVPFSTSANGNQDHTAGVYLNPETICLVGYGPEIVGGRTLEQQLGAGPGAYMPAGMTKTPQAPGGGPAPQPQPGPAQGGMPGGAPQYQPQPGPAQHQPQHQPGPAQGGMPGGAPQQPQYGGYMTGAGAAQHQPGPAQGGMPGAGGRARQDLDDEIPF
jgi:hypothetical protein